MRMLAPLLALAGSLLFTPMAAALSEYGIEGMGRVSTRANEGRASIAADGQRIVFASDRDGGAGGWDLWQSVLEDGRWGQPQPLALNTDADELDPYLSQDGRWLYFASTRRGGKGGADLYRAPVTADGYGPAAPVPGVPNSGADERSPTLSADGNALLFVRLPARGPGQVWLAQGPTWEQVHVLPMAEVADVRAASWLGDGQGLVFTRAQGAYEQVWVATCVDGRYDKAQPLALSFNTEQATTTHALVDASKPGELLVSGSARAPRAGGQDIYRLKSPTVSGNGRCR